MKIGMLQARRPQLPRPNTASKMVCDRNFLVPKWEIVQNITFSMVSSRPTGVLNDFSKDLKNDPPNALIMQLELATAVLDEDA